MVEQVILVDGCDREIGFEEKLLAHKSGKLHRAFSVFVFNSGGQLLLQRRAKNKYHCGALWSNTCCSHPRPAETVDLAAHRRLQEEMGFDCGLKELFSLKYKAEVSDGLIENEYDHVLVGIHDGPVNPEKEEVSHWKYMSLPDLVLDIQKQPGKYTYCLKAILPKLIIHMEKDRNESNP